MFKQFSHLSFLSSTYPFKFKILSIKMDEEQQLAMLNMALREEKPPADLYIPRPPPPPFVPSPWKEASTHVVDFDLEQAQDLDFLAGYARYRMPKKNYSAGQDNFNLSSRLYVAHASSQTHQEWVQKRRSLHKQARCLAYARNLARVEHERNVLHQKDPLAGFSFIHTFQKNPFWVPSAFEPTARGSGRTLPECAVGSNHVGPMDPARRAIKEAAQVAAVQEKIARRTRFELALEKKRSFFTRWRVQNQDVLRQARINRMRALISFVNHQIQRVDLTEDQKNAIVVGWLPIDWILSEEFRQYGYAGPPREDYVAQMESAHGETDAIVQPAGTTVMEDQREVSVANSYPTTSVDSFSKFSASPSEYSYTDRWLTVCTETWSSTSPSNTMLKTLDLPNDIIRNFKTTPNIMEFAQHVYWRGTMRIQVVVNSNLRQYGQLQVRFYYGADRDADFSKYRANIFSGSQQTHCLISANESNVGELVIPFEFIRPYLFIGVLPDDSIGHAALGRLMVSVIVPLTVKSGTEPSCRYSIRIKFENSEFKGQVYRGMRANGPLVDAVLKTVMNLDKPLNFQTGTMVVAQNSSSWAHGKGSDWSVPLRLDPNGLLPYSAGRIPAIDEMKISHVSSIFSMVKILDWLPTIHAGTKLWSFDASPTWAFNMYPQTLVNSRTCYVLPPVSVLANMFMYWRGSLRLRMDIVGAADLSGRLIVAYAPRCVSNFDYTRIFSFPHAIYDLQEKRQFVFEIPYIADQMFWPRRTVFDREHSVQTPPGVVYIYVYNDLISNLTIPSDCKIVCYLAAGPDFELAVPCAPSFGLSFNTSVWISKDIKDVCSFKDGYYPVYAGSWRNFGGGKRLILRYGNVTDHIAQVNVPNGKGEVLWKRVLKPLSPFICPIYVSDSKGVARKVNAEYFVLYPSEITAVPNYWYMLPFDTKSNAETFVKNCESDKRDGYALLYIKESDSYSVPAQMQFSYTDLSTDWVAQMDEREHTDIVLTPLSSAVATGAGASVMGESFTDLKDICCRYQRYASGTREVDPSAMHNFDALQLRFPAIPHGLELDLGVMDSINEYWNRTREGPIPIIASGYRFFTGGLRFRLIIRTYDASGTFVPSKIFVQHRPGHGDDMPVVTFANPNWLATTDLELPGFAFHVQDEMTNCIVNIEVPYYLPSIRGFLQRSDVAWDDLQRHSLGEVVVSVRPHGQTKFTFDYDIYYAFADDTRFSLFQGFPPVFDIATIPDIRNSPTVRARRRVPVLPDIPEEEPLPEPEPNPEPPTENDPPIFEEDYKERNYGAWTGYTFSGTVIVNKNGEEVLIFNPFNSNYSWTKYKMENSIPNAINAKFIHELFQPAYDLNISDEQQGNFNLFMQLYDFISEAYTDKQFQSVLLMFVSAYYLSHSKFRFPFLLPLEDGQVITITEESMQNNRHHLMEFHNYSLHNDLKTYNFAKDIFTMKKSNWQTRKFVGQGLGDFCANVATTMENLSKIDSEQVNKSTTEVGEAAQNIGQTAEKVNVIIDDIKDFFNAECQTDPIQNSNLDKYINSFISVLINASSFALSPSITSFVSSVMNVLNSIGVFSSSFVLKIFTSLSSWLTKLFSRSSEPYEDQFVAQGDLDDDNMLAGYISTLVAGIAGTLNFTHSLLKDQKRCIAKILLHDLKDFALTSNHLFTFCKNNINAIKRIYENLWQTQPTLEALYFFEEYDKDIFEWAKEVLSLTDGRNRDVLLGNIVKASKVYECANQAYLIQLKLLKLPKEVSIKIPKEKITMLTKLCRDIVKLRDELARAHIAPPVKFEPYVVHFYGERGIGKSFCGQDLPYKMLAGINYRSYNEIVYTRSAGNAYWNGLAHQPAVIFDDWYQITSPEFGGVQVAELLQLKTRAIYNPPMAAVEDKNIRYNPLIIFLCSNNSHPKYESVQDNKAIYRRIDMLVHVRRVARYRGVHVSRIPAEVLNNYTYLEFHRHPDVLDERYDANLRAHLNYSTISRVIVNDFKKFYARELVNYSKGIARMTSLYPKEGEECFKLPHQNMWTSSEEYMSYVPYEEENFNRRAREEVDYSKNSIVKWFYNLFKCNKFMANAPPEEEQPEVIIVQDEQNRPEGDFSDEDEFLPTYGVFVPERTSYPCAHSILTKCLNSFGAVYDWDSEYNCWSIDLLSVMEDQHNDNLEQWREKYYDIFPHTQSIADNHGNYLVYLVSILLNEAFTYSEHEIEIIPGIISYKYPVAMDHYFWWPENKIMVCIGATGAAAQLYLSHSPCETNYCIFKDVKFRNRCVSAYIDRNSFLKHCMDIGACMVDMVPDEYINSIHFGSFHDVTDEEIERFSWLKGYWRALVKFVRNINSNTIYRWIYRLCLLFNIMAPFFLSMIAINHVRKQIKNNYNLDNDVIVDIAKNIETNENMTRRLDLTGQGYGSGDTSTRGARRTNRAVASRFLEPMQHQMSSEELVSLKRQVLRNTFFLGSEHKETGAMRVGRCLGLYGHIALIPTHYLDCFKRDRENRNFYFIPTINPVTVSIDLDELKVVNFKSSSLSVIELPRRIPLFAHIQDKFAYEADHQKMNDVCQMYEVIKPKIGTAECSVEVHNLIVKPFYNVKVLATKEYEEFNVITGYGYEYFTGEGNCGSVLIAPNLQRGIVGMHVAGTSKDGLSEIVTREMIDQALCVFPLAPNPDEPYVGNIAKAHLLPDTEVVTLGVVPRAEAHRESERSRIVPSLIQLHGDREDFPIYKDVAVLSPRDKRLKEKFSPMLEGVRFHGMPLKPFRAEDVREVAEDLENMYLAKCTPKRSEVSKLTILEACNGIDGLEGYEHLEWRTSEGFPFVSQRPSGVHDKRWLFKFDEESNKCVGVADELVNLIEEQQQQRLNGVVPFTVFTDCLKDTTVALQKVLQPGKTRIFSMAPIAFTVAQRQLTLDFSVAMMGSRLDLEHAVGINPDSFEWTQLAERLLKNGSKIITGDYSKFGDTIPFEIIEAFFNLINKWYYKYSKFESLNNQNQRLVFVEEIGHAVHLMFNTIYRCLCGQPSGNSLTVLINSYANSFYMRLAWLSIMRGTIYAGLGCFKKHVCTYSYGDDLIASVTDEVASLFNAETLCKFFGEHRLKFTNADKSDSITPFTDLSEADFLKRGFELHPRESRQALGVLLAPLSIESIEDTVNWIWNSGYDFCDDRSPEFGRMCMQVCEDATRNAWTRGPVYYRQFCQKLICFWRSQGEYVVYDSWDALDAKIFDLDQEI